MRGCSSTISAVSRPISSGVVTVTLVSQVPKPCTVLVVKSTTPNVGSKRKLVNIPVETITHSVRSCARSNLLTSYCSSKTRSEEHTSELQTRPHLVCRLLLEKKKKTSLQ